MDVELLYFEDCPSWEKALANLRTALAEQGGSAEIRVVKIENAEDAQLRGFLGSPSIHVDGIDLWPDERRGSFWGCRVYRSPEGFRGEPTVKMIQEKLAGLTANDMGGVR